jgi:hypothetical protein
MPSFYAPRRKRQAPIDTAAALQKEKGPEEEEVPRAFALEATNIQLGVFNTLSGGTHPVCEVLHALEEASKEWKTTAAAY